MPDKYLYLLSSRSGFDTVAGEFVPKAGGEKAVITLLLYRGGEKAGKYIAEYAEPWIKRGIAEYHVVMPDESGKLDTGDALRIIGRASGIFIGGGDTAKYRELFANGPVAKIIKAKYREGVPVAGCSAGALITLEHCPLYDCGSERIKLKPGLDLLRGMMIEVHFSERDCLKPLLAAMKQSGIKTGLGIDEPACAVFENGKLARILGKSVYQISVEDMKTMAHQIKQL